MSEKEREKEFNELSHAIVEALSKDENVMGILADLQERNVIDASTLLGLALKVNALLEISGLVFAQDEPEEKTESTSLDADREVEKIMNDSSENEEPIVDGRHLTQNEVAFHEWVAEQFDEREWLKDSGLIW